LGAAAVWIFRGELFRPSQFNPPGRSIAVLPFADSSETKDQEYLGDGISEEILDTLTQVDGLRVVGRSSSFAFKGKNTNASEVGQKLNVGNVLEGSLRRQGNRVRVTAELIDARNGFRVWTETYDRELDAAFALQDEIAGSIVDALKIKLAVGVYAHREPAIAVDNRYLQGLFTDVTHPTGVSSTDIGGPVQNSPGLFTVPDYTFPGDFGPSADTRVTAAPPATSSITDTRDRASEAELRTNKIAADVIAAPPETAFSASARNRASEASLRTHKITANVTPAPSRTGSNISVRDRASEAELRTNKIAADRPASIQGFVKDARGEPMKGTDVRIESRDGKQVFSTVKTDSKGRYISQGLPPGVYRVTLLVNGAVKASIMNTQTKANQPTQLNFDFKPASQAGNIAKRKKNMVWVPNRTGSHLGGTWVEVDDKGNEHAESNVQTYTVRRW
jgi:TolB-like protein